MFEAYEHIGESSLDGALPWDTVRPVEYRAYQPVREYIPELTERHAQRAARSPDFIHINSQIAFAREQQERESWPLNEETLNTQTEAERRRGIETENMRRFLKGLPLLEILDGDDEDAESEVSETVDTGPETADPQALVANDAEIAEDEEPETEESDAEPDPLLEESARVLADYINLSGRQISAAGGF